MAVLFFEKALAIDKIAVAQGGVENPTLVKKGQNPCLGKEGVVECSEIRVLQQVGGHHNSRPWGNASAALKR